MRGPFVCRFYRRGLQGRCVQFQLLGKLANRTYRRGLKRVLRAGFMQFQLLGKLADTTYKTRLMIGGNWAV